MLKTSSAASQYGRGDFGSRERIETKVAPCDGVEEQRSSKLSVQHYPDGRK